MPHRGWVGASGASQWVGRGPVVPHRDQWVGWVGASGASQWLGRGQWCLTGGWVGASGASQWVWGQWCLTVGG